MVRRPRSWPVSIASMSFSKAWVASSPSVLTAAASLAILARLVALSRPISAMMSFCTLVVASAAAKPTSRIASIAFCAAAAPSPCDLASVRVMATARSACAASFAASMVHSLANSMAFLIASASRLPAVAPLTIEAVMPSIPPEAARADLVAAASMPDRFALTLLMDWFALSTSTVTTSSSWLLFAMGVRPLAIQLVPLVVQDQHRVELVGPDIVQADVDSQVQCRAQIESAPDEQTGFGGLRGIELVLGAVVAPATIRRVRTQARIAQLIAPECPMDEVAEGGILRPLPR